MTTTEAGTDRTEAATDRTAGPAALMPSDVMTQLVGGFQVSQALYVMAELDVATALDDGPRPVEQVAQQCGADPDVLRRLVRTLASLGVFATDGDLVSTTPLGATLSRNHPHSMRDLTRFWMQTHYTPFSQLLHTARTGEPAFDQHVGKPFFDWIGEEPSRAELLSGAMSDIVGGWKAGMLDGYELPAGTVVADIGGADAGILVALIADRPERRGIAFDLPEAVPSARANLAARGLQDRVEVVAGDFFVSVPPADVYVLSHILHDWDDASCVRILRSIAAAAGSGARVLVIEMIVPEGDGPHLSKALDLTMLAMVTGRERSAEDFTALLAAAGMKLDRALPTPSPYSIIEATVD